MKVEPPALLARALHVTSATPSLMINDLQFVLFVLVRIVGQLTVSTILPTVKGICSSRLKKNGRLSFRLEDV